MNYTFYILDAIFKVILALITVFLIITAFKRTYQHDKEEWNIKNSRVKKVDTLKRIKKMNKEEFKKNEKIRRNKENAKPSNRGGDRK